MKYKFKACCPFCKEKEALGISEYFATAFKRNRFCVVCYTCGARGPEGKTEKEALKAWEKRM
jgi:hypothetical protein